MDLLKKEEIKCNCELTKEQQDFCKILKTINTNVANKYLREANKTFVAIRCDEPYTAYDRVLEGDHMNDNDESLIDAVLKLVATELDPTGAIAEI